MALWHTTPIEKLLVTHGMDNSKPVSTLIIPARLGEIDNTLLTNKENGKYHSIVSSLHYLAVKTQPDIAVAASTLVSFVAEPKTAYLMAAKKTMCYL